MSIVRRIIATVVPLALALAAAPGRAAADGNPDGSYSHTIPIVIPRGVGAATPQLTLDYSSGSSDEILGQGWRLSGLPVITRGRYTEPVRYAASDTFFGPSGRLIAMTGGFYHPANEDWSKYIPSGSCGGGPCSWTLFDAAGNKWFFGATADSRIEAVGRGGAVRTWALNRFEDPSGNAYEVTYDEDSAGGDYYPKLIVYSKGPGITLQRTVEFRYEERPLHAPVYGQGARVDSDRRLTSISVSADGALVRALVIGYDAAGHLASVQERGNDVQSLLPAQRYTWPAAPATFRLEAATYADQSSRWNRDWSFSGDFDGDGRTDLASRNGGTIYLKQSTGAGFTHRTVTVPSDQWGSRELTFTGDFNGDGKSDIISLYKDCGTCGYTLAHTYLGNSQSGFTLSNWVIPGYDFDTTGFLWVGDFNGDGKTDIASREGSNVVVYRAKATGDGFNKIYWAGLSTWGGHEFSRTGDFDGDGKTDLMTANGSTLTVLRSTGSNFVATNYTMSAFGGSLDPKRTFFADFNGDGKTDVATARPLDSTHSQMFLCLSKGDGLDNLPGSETSAAWGEQNYTGDFDGDGLTDILSTNIDFGLFGGKSGALHSSRGTRFVDTLINTGATAATDAAVSGIGDFDGDGGLDVIVGAPKGLWDIRVYRAPRVIDAITVFENGSGSRVDVTYTPAPQLLNAVRPDLTQCGGGSGAVCGIANASARLLATDIVRSDGNGHSYVISYEYYNGRVLRGLPGVAANLGFQGVSVLNEATGVHASNGYYQVKPYAGSEASQVVYVMQGGVDPVQQLILNVTIAPPTQVACDENGCSANATIDLASPRQLRSGARTTSKYELGKLLYSTTQTPTYDRYGSTTIVDEVAKDPAGTVLYTLRALKAYHNQLANPRVLGLTYESKLCGDTSCSDPQEWTRQYYDDRTALDQVGTRLLPTRSEKWRGGSSFAATVRSYDTHGNKLTESAPNGLVTTYQYEDGFQSDATRISHPLLGETALSIDPRFNQPETATHESGLRESFVFDAFGRTSGKRVEQVTGPVSGTLLRKQTFFAHIGDNGSWSMRCNLLDSDANPANGIDWQRQQCTTSWVDGLGRRTLTRAPATGTSGFAFVKIEYDAAGREWRVSEPTDFTPSLYTVKEYDVLGRPVKVTHPDGTSTTAGYNGGLAVPGAVTNESVTDPRGKTSVRYFDAHGRVVQVIEGRGFSCNDSGLCLNQAGATTKYAYDAKGRLSTVTGPTGQVTTIGYDAAGRRSSVSNPNTGTITWTYYDTPGVPEFEQVKTETRPAPNGATGTVVTTYFYDAKGRLQRRLDSDGAEAVMTYDESDVPNGIGRLTSARYSAAGFVVTERRGYDLEGRLSDSWRKVVAADGTVLADAHTGVRTDEGGRPVGVTNPDGSAVTVAYAGATDLVERITLDGVEMAHFTAYDPRGKLTRLELGNGTATDYTYEPATGLLATLRTKKGSTALLDYGYSYDQKGNITRVDDALTPALTTTYVYDALDRVVSAQRGDGKKFGYRYGIDGNLTMKSTFDAAGNVIAPTRSFIAGTSRLQDDGAGTTLGWSAAGSLVSDGTTAYEYDAHNLLQVVTRAGSVVERTIYDHDHKRVLRIEYPKPGIELRTYFLAGTYEVQERWQNGVRVARRASRHVLGPDGNRLASKTLDVSISGPAGVPTTTKGTLSTIDPRSLWLLLLGLSLAGALVLYGSSARRRRRGGRTPGRLVLVRGVTPALLALLLPTYGCGPQMMPATARSEALTEGSVLDPAGTVYYHGNHLGSASVVSDAAGNEILRVTYAPFGEIDPVNSGKKTATGTLDKNVPMAPIGFTGQSFGRESGLYHLQARVYDPGLGIMTTPDTMVPDPLSGKDLNAYAYARGNPVRYYDPTGHIVWLVPVLIGFAVGAMIGGTKGEILRNPFEAETWNNFSWKGALAGGAIGAAVGYGWWALGAYVPGSTFGVANGAILQSGLTGGITNTVLTYAGGENDPWQLAAAFGAGAINGMFAKTGMWSNPLYSFAVKPIVTALDPNRPLQFGAFGFEWEHGSGWDFSFRFNWGYWVTMALELTITTNWPLSNIREGQLASLEEKAGFWVLSFTFDETVMRKWEDWVFAEGSDGGAAQKGAFFLGVLFFGGMRVGLGALMLNNIVCADDPDSCGIPPNEW